MDVNVIILVYLSSLVSGPKKEGVILKKTILVLIVGLLFVFLIGCSHDNDKINVEDVSIPSNETESDEETSGKLPPNHSDDKVIRVWSDIGESTDIFNKFIEMHPDFDYTIEIIDLLALHFPSDPALYDTLVNDSKLYNFEVPDIYPSEVSYAAKYTKGEASQYAIDYKELGIDVDTLLEEASIPQYFIDLGTNPEGQLVGLGYHNTAGAFIYRRSIAKDVWGTDDPLLIQEKIGPGWEKFFEAAEDLRRKGYGICSGTDDVWRSVKNEANQPWIVDDSLYIDPKREEYIDIAKKLIESDYTNNTLQWSDEWYLDMIGEGEKEVFGFLGPAWLINYVLEPNCGGEAIGEGTYGDWAICDPPVGSFWGGSVVMAHKDTKHKEAVGEIIQWITLDISESGFQYLWANGESTGLKEMPLSTTVMRNMDYSSEFLGGQNIFEAYISAGDLARGDNISRDDEIIDELWRSQVHEYTEGKKSRENAIAEFKLEVTENEEYRRSTQ